MFEERGFEPRTNQCIQLQRYQIMLCADIQRVTLYGQKGPQPSMGVQAGASEIWYGNQCT